jgi:putative tryptophan/tyrosine transport system substrate-binding protein
MGESKRVGVLYGGYPQPWHEPFTQRIQAGYEVDARYARGKWGDHIQEMANDLIASGVNVFVTMDTPAMNAATNATSTIPIVSLVCKLPDESAPLRPEGNLTGLVNKEIDTGRQLRMLVELLRLNNRESSPLAVLYNEDNPGMTPEILDIEAAATILDPKVEIIRLTVKAPDFDLERAFGAYGDAKALIVLEEPVTVQNREQILQFAKANAVPGMYETRTFLEGGGLLCYGPDRHQMYLRMADYVKHIADNDLRPGNLPPMEQIEPTLHINRVAARELGIDAIPDSIDGVHWAD